MFSTSCLLLYSQFRSRILEPEQILGDKSSKATYQLDNADWGSAFRKWQQLSVANCSKWAVIHNPKYGELLDYVTSNSAFDLLFVGMKL